MGANQEKITLQDVEKFVGRTAINWQKDDWPIVIAFLRNKPKDALMHLTGMRCHNVDLQSIDFSNSLLENIEFTNVNFSHVRFGHATMTDVSFNRCDMSSTKFPDASLCDVKFKESCLAGASFNNASISGSFYHCTMHYADFRNADISNTSYDVLEMLKINFESAHIPRNLVGDMMAFDASCHPYPKQFDVWANGGDCPYRNINIIRTIPHFNEDRAAWGRGKGRTPWQIWKALAKIFNITI